MTICSEISETNWWLLTLRPLCPQFSVAQRQVRRGGGSTGLFNASDLKFISQNKFALILLSSDTKFSLRCLLSCFGLSVFGPHTSNV